MNNSDIDDKLDDLEELMVEGLNGVFGCHEIYYSRNSKVMVEPMIDSTSFAQEILKKMIS